MTIEDMKILLILSIFYDIENVVLDWTKSNGVGLMDI